MSSARTPTVFNKGRWMTNIIIASVITLFVLVLVLYVNKKDRDRKKRDFLIDNFQFKSLKDEKK